MLDNRSGMYDGLSLETVRQLCNRRFGVGADGLIKINRHAALDFEVDYYNADGTKSFCGNGARCAVKFCQSLGMDVSNTAFMAIDGEHTAAVSGELVSLGMRDVTEFEKSGGDYIIHTGSPHYIRFEKEIQEIDIVALGRQIRYADRFRAEGINVNVLEVLGEKHIAVRTYERGVEDETLSCGTGVTACAMAYALEWGLTGGQKVKVDVQGGTLWVHVDHVGNGIFRAVRLIGPAEGVYRGSIHV